MTEPIIATVKQGQLKGTEDTDFNGETFYKFLGIPYAKPPVGTLRFKAPQPPDSWSGIRDATKEGSPCLNLDILTKKIEGSENCLNLNIFTKQLPKPGMPLNPVMVFIHGGGFTSGSNSQQLYGAKYLLCEDIVLVTINYRLGVFGFLSSDDLSLDVPGNAGLKDQTFALKWIQENISSFNGDPNNVTIFGESAGGASVHFQVLTPTSKGLFHKAITQSGAALNPWAWGQKNIIQVGKQIDENVSSEKEALNILFNTDALKLFESALKIPEVPLNLTNRRPFGPVIETPHATAFLTKYPEDLLKSGEFNQVPLIIGCNTNEGLVWEMEVFKFPDPKLEELAIPWCLNLDKDSKKYEKVKAMIKDFYLENGMTRETIHKIVGDVCFVDGILESAVLAAQTSCNPVYLYVFSYETSTKFYEKILGIKESLTGTAHGDELWFLFNTLFVNIQDLQPEAFEEFKTGIKALTKIWTDFARTGRPHPDWEPVSNKDLQYFDINKECKLRQNPFPERTQLSKKILEESSGYHFNVQEKS